jgi:hypothetical protein
MSARWRCAVCEAVNDGGDVCAACGATVTQTVVQAPPAAPPLARERATAPEARPSGDAATEIPVRELSRRSRLEPDRPDDGPYEVYDLFDVVSPAETNPTYGAYEPIDTRPRIRVYGCCLPIALGMLLALVATVTLLANLLLGAL